jgi:hypothetical protein
MIVLSITITIVSILTYLLLKNKQNNNLQNKEKGQIIPIQSLKKIDLDQKIQIEESKYVELERNINQFKNLEKKVISEYEKYYLPFFSTNWYQCDIEEIDTTDHESEDYIFGREGEYPILSPHQTKIKEEFEKCILTLNNEKLKITYTNRFHLLANEEGFIFIKLQDKFSNNQIYICKLTLPVGYIEKFKIENNNSKFKFELNFKYLRNAFKRIENVSIFYDLVKKTVLFNNSNFSSKIDLDAFLYTTVKENVKIPIKDLVNLMVETKIISLNEYIINVELGVLNFNIDIFLEILFDKQYIGSFYSKGKNKLKITKTTFGILTIDDFKIYLKELYLDKSHFIRIMRIDSYLENIKFQNLKNEEFYKKCFNYDLIKENEFKDIEYFNHSFLSSPYLSSPEQKEVFLNQELFLNNSSINLIELMESKLREIENTLRIDRGYNIVGTFTNESILFNKLKTHFNEEKVVSQGKPKWLGKQSLDIFFPDYNIGVEYQGDQHYRPIDYFGGEDKFELQKILDNRKRDLCLLNNCILFEVREGYDFNQLVLDIEEKIFIRKNH